jgi:PAS domain S-box-containing protein
LVGFCVVCAATYFQASSIKNRLLLSTETLAATIDPQIIKQLKGNLQDEETDNYKDFKLRLRDVIKSVQNENISQISVLSRTENNITYYNIFVDGNKDILPGTIYRRPPSVLKLSFTTGKPFVSVPYVDENGSFLSAFVPIRVDGRYVVLAASIENSAYESMLRKSQASLVILISIILILFIILRRNHLNRAQEIRESEDKLGAIADNINEGIFTTKISGVIDFWSGGAEKLFGYSFLETRGKNVKNLIYNEQDERSVTLFEDFYLEFIRNKGKRIKGSTDITLQKKSGKSFIAEISLVLIDKNKDNYVVWVIKDITMRKLMEQEIIDRSQDLERSRKDIIEALDRADKEKQKLEESQAKDEAYLSSIGEGVLVVDKKETIIKVNPQVKEILGFEPEELVGKDLTKTLTLLDEKGKPVEVADRPVKPALKEKRKQYFNNYSYISKSGKEVPITITLAPVILDDEIIGVVNVFHDATAEREIEKAKSEFVSLASHQLRTPLSSINWYSEMLLNGDAGELNKEQKEFIGEIHIGSKRMVDLVDAFLNASRIDMGTFAVDPILIDFTEIADSILKELEPEIQAKKQTVKTKYQKNLPEISADPRLIRIVFQNYLSNAVKYTPEKGKISLKVYISKDKNDVIIEVADNGYGIPENQKDDIFKKLFRADNIKNKSTEGNGLGLYIVKSIIDNSKGSVWFDSEEGKGSTFYAKIPLSGMKKKKEILMT